MIALVALPGVLAVAVAGLAWRRFTGTLDTPLEPFPILAIGATVASVAAMWRRAARAVPWRMARSGGPLESAVSLGCFLLGLCVSLPETSFTALLALWTPMALEAFWAWRRRGQDAVAGRGPTHSAAHGPHDDAAVASGNENETAPSAASDASPVMPGIDVTQQLTRTQAADGCDAMAGWLRVRFVPGQRTANVHVAFCPPFDGAPQVTAIQKNDAAADDEIDESVRIKVGQVLPFGVRIEVRLAEAASKAGEEILLEFSAICRQMPDNDRSTSD
jgi:hypothetical protein